MNKAATFADRQRARRRVLQTLYQWQLTGQDIVEIQRQFCEEQDMSTVDVDYFKSLGREIVAEREALDEALRPLLMRDPDHLDPLERAALWIGACELLHHPETPVRVAINEAVDLAARFGSEQGHSFVNGVLDQGARLWRAAELQTQE